MPELGYSAGKLHFEDVGLSALAAAHGSPLYVYSQNAMLRALAGYRTPLIGRRHLVCYAVKANSTLAVLQTFARAGCGFDIVSVGELERVLAAGGSPSQVVFAGVGKRRDEVERAIEVGIKCFNVESEGELLALSDIASGLNKPVPVSLRVNPEVSPNTHHYISTGGKENKFGVPLATAADLYRLAARLPAINVVGINFHIGSQITEVAPYMRALDCVLDLIDVLEAEGLDISHIDVGGGWGISYLDEALPEPGNVVSAILDRLDARGYGNRELVIEPGRSLVGNAGVLVMQVLGLKPTAGKNFCIVDGGMNDLIRPAMYDAYMHIVQCVQPPDFLHSTVSWDVVGPVCESGDWLGRDRTLLPVVGEHLAVLSAGAYGMCMASNYNSRPRPAEVMVNGKDAILVRRRETIPDLLKDEILLAVP